MTVPLSGADEFNGDGPPVADAVTLAAGSGTKLPLSVLVANVDCVKHVPDVQKHASDCPSQVDTVETPEVVDIALVQVPVVGHNSESVPAQHVDDVLDACGQNGSAGLLRQMGSLLEKCQSVVLVVLVVDCVMPAPIGGHSGLSGLVMHSAAVLGRREVGVCEGMLESDIVVTV